VSRAAAIYEPSGILVAGGLATGDVSTAAIVRVDPGAGKATRAGTLPLAVHDTAGAFLEGAAFVFGGGAATTVGNVQRVAGTATAMAGSLPRPRSDLAVATDGTKAYIVGGFDGHAIDADVLVTTTGTTFTPLGTLPVPVRYPATALAAGALWVIGGQLSTAESTKTGGQSDAIQRIDLKTGAATIAGHLPTTLGHAAAFSLGDQLFVAGGQVVTTPSARILRIDTGNGAVADAGALPGPRSDAAVAVVDGTAWLLGGETTDPAHPLATVVEIRAS
jgi:non-specific serine/threonine protein kinase